MVSFLGSITLILITILTVIFTSIYFYFTRNFNFWRKFGVPHLKPMPFVGNLNEVLFQRIDMASKLRNVYENNKDKPYVGIFAFDKPVLVVNDLDLVKKIVVKDSQAFINHVAEMDENVDPIFGRMLFLQKGKRWRHLRVNLSPVFTSGKMKMMFYLVENCGKELAHYLKEESAKGSPVLVRDMLARYTTDAISTCALGIESNSLKNPNAEMRHYMSRVFDFSVWKGVVGLLLFFSPDLLNFLRFKFVDAKTANFFRDTVYSTMKYRKKHGIVRRDLLDSLIELKNKTMEQSENGKEGQFQLDNELLVAQAFQIFIGGFETSSSSTTFALYQLALNPEVQSRLRAEIMENLEKYNQEVTYDGLNEMLYLEMVISETLRMYPVLGFLDRVCAEDYEIPKPNGKGSFILPKGTLVYIPLLGFHNDPKYFPEPQKFDPERFTEDNKISHPNYSYMPFGEGPRICIGKRFGLMQMKTALVHILSNFEVTPCKDTPSTLEFDPKSFLLHSLTEIKLNFKGIAH